MSLQTYLDLLALPDDEMLAFRRLAVLTGKTYDEILSQPLAVTDEEMAGSAFLNTQPKQPFIKLKYHLGEHTYRPQFKLDEITTAQYIDIQFVDPKNVKDVLSIILIPEGKKYNTDYDKDMAKKEIAENLKVTDAMAIANFFTAHCTRLTRIITRQCKRKIRRAIRKAPTEEIKTQLTEALRIMDES